MRTILKKNYKNLTFLQFINKIKNNTTNDINVFISWLKTLENPIDFQLDDIIQDWAYLNNRILSEVANIHWGKNYSYFVLLLNDKQFQASIENL